MLEAESKEMSAQQRITAKQYRAYLNGDAGLPQDGIIAPETKPSKYRNKKVPFTSIQGFSLTAASKQEARDYGMLDLGIKAGTVIRWVPQVSFLLQGGSRYRCDALVFWADGSVTVRDAKGFETPEFKIKRGLMKSTYGLEIELVGK